MPLCTRGLTAGVWATVCCVLVGGANQGAIADEAMPNPRIVIQARLGVDEATLSDRLAAKGFGGVGGAARQMGAGLRPAMDPPAKNAALARKLGLDRFYTLEVEAGADASATARAIAAEADLVARAECEGRAVLARDSGSNDPLFPQQWYLNNTGQTGGLAGADIRCEDAWALASIMTPVTVAVLDTGVSSTHPDLRTLVSGRNTCSVANPAATEDSTSLSHGTYCAGILGAVRNNATGVAGVAPNVRIMPMKVVSGQYSTQTTVGNGVIWAADNGAQIESMSLGFGAGTPVTFLQTAVQYADASGVLMFASTGNSPGSPVGYPAAWPQVVAVGGTDGQDRPFAAGTTGPEMDISAPADNIFTTINESWSPNGYAAETGTSMSCPIVAGVAAMIWGVNPALLPVQVRGILYATAVDLGAPGWDPVFGWGRVDAGRAVQIALSTTPCTADTTGDRKVSVDDIYTFLGWFFAKDPRADIDGALGVTVNDVLAYLQHWFGGC